MALTVNPGEYTVNLYYYKSDRGEPVEALVKVEKVNPTLQTVFVEKVLLERQDDEKTVVRLTLDRDGTVTAFSHLQTTLTPYALEP